MKTLLLSLVSLAAFSTGCLVNRPYALKETPVLLYDTNGVAHVGHERIITKSTTFAAGDAKQQVDKLKASVTKTTASAGAEGVSQDAEASKMMESLFRAAFLMGRSMGGVPPPLPPQ